MDWPASPAFHPLLLQAEMPGVVLFWVAAFITVGLGLVVYVIASDKRRFLTRFDVSQWREGYYLRALPNFLQALHDHHFRTPWPTKPNALATAYFRYRARPLLKKRSPALRRAFLQQHITLFALLEVLQPYLDDFILNEQQRIAGARILEMEDTLDRDRLLGFLESARGHRASFFRSLTDYDRKTLAQIIDRRLIPTLRRAHAIFQEHGYSLLSEFTQLRRWEEMTGVELVQELPVLPALRRQDLPSQQPAPRG
jgi:hypothetical protein